MEVVRSHFEYPGRTRISGIALFRCLEWQQFGEFAQRKGQFCSWRVSIGIIEMEYRDLEALKPTKGWK